MNIDWFMLIIPAVAVGIWAVKTAMEKGAEANRNLPPQGRPVGRPQSASAEIDRFLEEVNRRRQEQQQRQARRSVEPPRTVEVQVEPQPTRPRPVYRPRSSAPPPVRRSSAEPVIVINPEQVIPQALPVTAALAPAPPAPPRVARPVAPFVQDLQGLLRSSRTARTAFILTEIFGKPLCRRPRT